MKRVEKICERENITIKRLAGDISLYVDKYGPTGNYKKPRPFFL